MAEFWYRKATAMIPEPERNTDLDSPMQFQKIRVKRIYGPLTIDFPITVDFTEFGRAVFATDNLEPGWCFKCILYISTGVLVATYNNTEIYKGRWGAELVCPPSKIWLADVKNHQLCVHNLHKHLYTPNQKSCICS